MFKRGNRKSGKNCGCNFYTLHTLLSQRLQHPRDAAFLLFHVWMHIEVERGGDIGVTEQHTDRLVVAVALYAARSEAVAQSVVFQARNV